ITVDANHELAGKKLFFDVTITDVRDATDEELSAVSGDSCGCSSGGCGGCSGCGGGCGCF
ncbi:MAG: peptidylprolyl isomerase, partial [Treponema maltophilum]